MEKRKRYLSGVIIILSVITLAINSPQVLADQTNYVEIPLSTGTFKLVKPIEIDSADMYRDGGTIYVVLKDTNGKTFPFCLDGRMQALRIFEKPRPYHIFIRVMHPSIAGAQEIPINGKEEKILLKVLEDWIKENVSEEEQRNLQDVLNYEKIKWTDKSYKARRILQLVDRLKKR